MTEKLAPNSSKPPAEGALNQIELFGKLSDDSGLFRVKGTEELFYRDPCGNWYGLDNPSGEFSLEERLSPILDRVWQEQIQNNGSK